LKERDSKLEEAGDLHRFLRDLDHFQAWLTKTQTDVASEDTPSSLSDAEKLLSQHQAIREEIDNYTADYTQMMEYGEKVTAVCIIYNTNMKQFLLGMGSSRTLRKLNSSKFIKKTKFGIEFKQFK